MRRRFSFRAAQRRFAFLHSARGSSALRSRLSSNHAGQSVAQLRLKAIRAKSIREQPRRRKRERLTCVRPILLNCGSSIR